MENLIMTKKTKRKYTHIVLCIVYLEV
jgi:hypothetical protein